MYTEYDEKKQGLKKYLNDKLKIMEQVEAVFAMDEEEFELWQHTQLKNVIQNAKDNSFFYREKYREVMRDEEFFNQPDYLNKIPFILKEEIASQYPFGLLSADMNEIVRYGESSGTTGDPINSYCTRNDWLTNNMIVSKWLSNIITSKDVVAMIVPYELALVGQDLDRAVEMIGATTIAIGALTKCVEIERVVKMLKSLEVTTLICSPTRILFLAEEIAKLGLDPKKDFKIRKFLCPGEGTSIEKKKLIESIWGAEIYPMYGMTETNTLAMPCKCGELHLVNNKAFFEIVDPVTGETLGEDRRGELVVTTFVKGMPLIRYRTGDLCTINSRKCECGKMTKTLVHHGRIQDHIHVNGVDYQILDLEEVILGFGDVKFYTLKVPNSKELEIGLVAEPEIFEIVKEKITSRMKEKYQLDVKIRVTSMKKIEEVIKISIKPSIKSILLN